jgi:hypothetical protein
MILVRRWICSSCLRRVGGRVTQIVAEMESQETLRPFGSADERDPRGGACRVAAWRTFRLMTSSHNLTFSAPVWTQRGRFSHNDWI